MVHKSTTAYDACLWFLEQGSCVTITGEVTTYPGN